MELKTNKEKNEMIEKWIQYIGKGRKVVGIRNNNLKLKIKTKNFLVAFSIIFSSSVALILLALLGIYGGELKLALGCLLCEIPFALIGYFINKRSFKSFETFQDGTFKVNGLNYYSKTDYLNIYIRKIKEDNFDIYLNTALKVSGNYSTSSQLTNMEYYHIVLETAIESTKIGFSSENANKIFDLLSSFIYGDYIEG